MLHRAVIVGYALGDARRAPCRRSGVGDAQGGVDERWHGAGERQSGPIALRRRSRSSPVLVLLRPGACTGGAAYAACLVAVAGRSDGLIGLSSADADLSSWVRGWPEACELSAGRLPAGPHPAPNMWPRGVAARWPASSWRVARRPLGRGRVGRASGARSASRVELRRHPAGAACPSPPTPRPGCYVQDAFRSDLIRGAALRSSAGMQRSRVSSGVGARGRNPGWAPDDPARHRVPARPVPVPRELGLPQRPRRRTCGHVCGPP